MSAYLAVSPVARVGEERLRQVGEERLEDARALVDGELAAVEVDDDALVQSGTVRLSSSIKGKLKLLYQTST